MQNWDIRELLLLSLQEATLETSCRNILETESRLCEVTKVLSSYLTSARIGTGKGMPDTCSSHTSLGP